MLAEPAKAKAGLVHEVGAGGGDVGEAEGVVVNLRAVGGFDEVESGSRNQSGGRVAHGTAEGGAGAVVHLGKGSQGE